MLISSRYFFFRLCLVAGLCSSLSLRAVAHAGAPDSGICGTMVAAWGNPPANPPAYRCVKVFDSTGQKLIATGVCSGLFGEFRIALPPGHYLIDKSAISELPGATIRPAAGSVSVEVEPGKWAQLAPRAPARPVP